MKVYYIWDNENKKVISSNDYKSGIYTDIVSVVFAFSQLSFFQKSNCEIRKATLADIFTIHKGD